MRLRPGCTGGSATRWARWSSAYRCSPLSRASLRQAFDQWRWLPTGLLALGTLASAALAGAVSGTSARCKSPLFFVPHLLLCWMAARSGLFAASATALVLIAGTVVATLHGLGPFLRPETGQGISTLVGYICSLLAIPLLTTALTGEIATNERRWQLALDTSHIGVGEWDLTNGRIEFSPRWLALLGHSSQDFGDRLQAFWALVHPDDVAVGAARLRAAARGAINCRAECRMLCRDGSWRPFEAACTGGRAQRPRRAGAHHQHRARHQRRASRPRSPGPDPERVPVPA